MQTNLDYFIVGLVIILIIFSVALGPTKILRIIIGNYIIGFLIIGVYLLMEMINFKISNGSINLGHSQEVSVQNVIINQKQAVGLFFYLILLVIFVNKSRVEGISLEDRGLYNWLLIFGPLTAISIITTLLVVILGTNVMNYQQVLIFANQFTPGSVVYKFIANLPLWIVLPGIAILFGSMDLPFFRKKKVVVTTSG